MDVRQRMTIPIWSHLSILGSSIHFWGHTFKSLICSSSGLWANQAWLFRYHEVKQNVITNSPHLFLLLFALFVCIHFWVIFRHLVHCRDAPGWHHKTNLTLQLSVALTIWKKLTTKKANMMFTNLKFVSLLDHDISSVSFPMRRLKMVKPVLTPPANFFQRVLNYRQVRLCPYVYDA